jgi:hypothetical protein
VIHAYGNTELFKRANIEESLEENLGCCYCNLLSVAWSVGVREVKDGKRRTD